jgi:predicted outer membrane repeat protein
MWCLLLVFAICLSEVVPAADCAARTWIVAADGSGDFQAVSEALEAAASGDSIAVQPGEYWEPDHDEAADPPIAVADKALTVIGAGAAPTDVSLRLRMTFDGSGSLQMTGLRFHDTGGALGLYPDQGATVETCVFEDNDAAGGSGGAIACEGPSIWIRDCAFYRNHARRGGAIATVGDDHPWISGCLFDGNSAEEDGGAVLCAHCWVSLSVFSSNTAPSGGAIKGYGDFQHGIVELECNTFWRNGGASCIALIGPGGVRLCIVAESQGVSFDCSYYPYLVNCCCAYANGGEQEFPYLCNAPYNIVADPLFCDPEHGDFGLREDSPCRPGGFMDCGQMGARGVDCGESPVRTLTWGRLKSLYRETGRQGR